MTDDPIGGPTTLVKRMDDEIRGLRAQLRKQEFELEHCRALTSQTLETMAAQNERFAARLPEYEAIIEAARRRIPAAADLEHAIALACLVPDLQPEERLLLKRLEDTLRPPP